MRFKMVMPDFTRGFKNMNGNGKVATHILAIALCALLLFSAAAMPLSNFSQQANAAPMLPMELVEGNDIGASAVSAQLLADRPGLPFVLNKGQEHPDVRFYVDTFAGKVYVTDTGLTYSLRNADSTMTIKESFVQANPLRSYGIEQNPAVVNHFAGDSSNWKSQIPTFNKVSFGEVWQGIDVELKAADNNVEKIFTVAPGANVADIQLALEGSEALYVNNAGQLVLVTELGEVALTKPVAFQEVDGQIRSVKVSYDVVQNNQYGFAIDTEYDPNYPLVIDPLLASTYLGGADEDEGVSPLTLHPIEGSEIAISSDGEVFIAGLTLSESYPETVGAGPDPDVSSDVVVSKLSGDLTQLLASTYIAGGNLDEATDIAVDSSGDVYVTGRTNSTDYPGTSGSFDEDFNGGMFDGFVSKLDDDLDNLVSTYIGGNASDESFDLVPSATGSVLIAGRTFSIDYPTTGGAYDTTFNAPGQSQAFVTILDDDLDQVDASTLIGGSNDSGVYAMALNSTGYVYVAGFTLATDFPIVNAYDTDKSAQNQHDTFVAIFDSNLSVLEGSTFHGAGNSAGEHTTPYGIALSESEGKVYIAGQTASDGFPTTSGVYDEDHNGDRDAYVSVLSSSLDSLLASTVIGADDTDIASGLALTDTSVYVTVIGGGPNYPTTAGAYDEGDGDSYISSLSVDLVTLQQSTHFGGTETDILEAIAVDSAGDVYVLGHTRSTNFPTSSDAYQPAHTGPSGNFDYVISKLTPDLAASAGYHLLVDNANGDCEAIGGSWSAPICTLSTTLSLATDDSLEIDSGVTLQLTGSVAITNSGTVTNAGTISGDGAIDSELSGVINTGSITVYVRIPDTALSAPYSTNFPIQIPVGATLTIDSGGTLTINPQPGAPHGDTALRVDGNLTNLGTINNAGLITGNNAIDSPLSGITNTGGIVVYIRIPDTTLSLDYATSFPIWIAAGRTLDIDTGVTLLVNPQPNAPHGDTALRIDGSLNNLGTLNNTGLITGNSPIDSELDSITNTGSILVYVRIPDTTLFAPYSTNFPIWIEVGRTLTIETGAILTVSPQPNAPHGGTTLRIDGTLLNRGTLDNTALITGNGSINNDCGGIINNTGTILTSTFDICADTSPPNHPPLNGLVSWYRAENNFEDSVGDNDGVEQSTNGGVDFVPGRVGQSFDFGGSDWVEIDNDPTLNFGTSSFTASAWIKANSNSGNILVHGASGCVTPIEAGWQIHYGFAGGEFPIGNIGFDIRAGDGTVIGQQANRPIAFAAAPSMGEWHHIAGVLDRGNDLARLYIDGQEVATDAIPAGFGSADNNGKPAIGVNNRGGNPLDSCSEDGFYNGLVDEVTLHSRALTPTEVQSMFEQGMAILINSGDETTSSPDVFVTLRCDDTQSGCDTIELTFANIDANSNSIDEDSIPIDVSSDTDAVPKVLDAEETAANTGIFVLEIEIGDGSGDTIAFNLGDAITAEGLFFDAAAGTKSIDARYTDGDGNSATQSDTIELLGFNPTTLTLNALRDVTATTGFTVSGELVDAITGEPVPGQLITFSGSGASPLPSVTTEGVTFTGAVELVACDTPTPPEDDECTTDNVGTDGDTSDNIVLHLDAGGKVMFPAGTVTARIDLQGMGTTPFMFSVVNNDDSAVDCNPDLAGTQDVCSFAGADSPIVAKIELISGYLGGEPLGLKELTITEVDGSASSGFVGISAILTGNPDGLPVELHQINFEELSAGSQTSPFTVNAGHYFATGFSQDTGEEDLRITAHFGGSSAHLASDSEEQTYAVLDNTGGLGGEGSQSLGGATGTAITTMDCNTDVGSVDSDGDGICDIWETSGVTFGTANYQLIGAVVGQADIFVEIDCMTGFCPTNTDLTKVQDAFEAEGYTLHIDLDETNLSAVNPLHVWTDTDANANNDFASIKNNRFGTTAERSAAGGNLGQGRDLLEAKAQVFHYGLFARNINTGTNTTCGPSGQAELRGNDFIVSVGCTGANGFQNSAQERQGTLMHELGHNLGLRHGGGDDTNCKPNLISVMNYPRQMPWGSLSATTGSGAPTEWSLTYSREDLDDLSETNLQEGNGLQITASRWTSGGTSSLAPGSNSFKIIWGIPAVKTGSTGATVNWNNAAGNTASLNINTLSGMTGCSGTTKSTLKSYDEWALLDLNFRDGGSIDGLQYPDPDTLPELTPVVYEGTESASVVGPNDVFTNPGLSALPDVATDSDGNIFVVWNEKSSFSSKFEIYFSRSTDGGATFSPPESVSNNNGDSLTPRIAVLNGILHVVWSDKTGGTSGNYDIMYSKSNNMGDDWSPSVKLTSNSGDSLTPSLAAFGSDLYVVWSDKTGGTSGKFDIQFKKSTNGGTSFTPAGASGTKVSSNSGDSLTPDVEASANGIFIVWSDTSGGTSGKFDILFKKSTNGGATFLPNTANAKNISTNSGLSVTPSIAVDGNSVYVTWSDTTGGTSGNFDILFKKSTDGGNTFTPNNANANNISKTSGLSSTPRISVSSGNVYITWSDVASGNLEILAINSGDSGDNFDLAVNISTTNGASITPAVAILDPVVHVVWGDLTAGITGNIMHSSRIV
jgi:hypothetical protein